MSKRAAPVDLLSDVMKKHSRPRANWSDAEKKLAAKLVMQGLTASACTDQFPERDVSQIASLLQRTRADLRKEGRLNVPKKAPFKFGMCHN
jgi:hypothetical protein